MKIRNGFVSNSSSSSFIVATKGVGEDEIKKVILEKLRVPKDSPLYFVAESMADIIASSDDDDDYIDEYEEAQEFLKQGYEVRIGSVASDACSEDGIEEMMYSAMNEDVFEIDTPELKIKFIN